MFVARTSPPDRQDERPRYSAPATIRRKNLAPRRAFRQHRLSEPDGSDPLRSFTRNGSPDEAIPFRVSPGSEALSPQINKLVGDRSDVEIVREHPLARRADPAGKRGIRHQTIQRLAQSRYISWRNEQHR